MSQTARAKASQTIKSLSYLYKLCGATIGCPRYCSINPRSYVNDYTTLSSVAAYDFRNPDEFSSSGGKNPNGVLGKGNSTRVYWQSYNSGRPRSENSDFSQVNHNKGYHNQHSSNRLYEEEEEQGRIVQYTSSNINNSHISRKQVAWEGSGQHFATDQRHANVMFNETSVWGNGGHSSSYQQNSGMNYQIPNGSYNGMASGQISGYDQPEEKLDKEEGCLSGTIEELDAFCKDRKLKEAVEVLGLLEQNNVSVDMLRYLFLMNECGEAQALEEAKLVHEHLARSASHLDVYVCNKILEMYSKCSSMEDAYKVFDKMSQRNLTSWDTMITWLAKNGHGEDAIDRYMEFRKTGLKPDYQMFFGVFAACSVLGDMKEGLLHFESMSKNYNIVPTLDHYRSVVDMLGSAGYLTEALEFIESMPIEPSVEIWQTMMNQCRIHGNTELGDRCTELIEVLDPSLLDEQSKAGLIPVRASDIAKEKEKKKLSGFNTLEIKTKVYEYRAGDTSHPEHEKLYSQLRCLKQTMKEGGYVAETKFVLHDVDQESKEEALLSHSERLALSQALLTSPARSPVRIIKNLRVCGDCHNALKIISKLVGRLIVARDAKRFHHFENGVCSCGDYW